MLGLNFHSVVRFERIQAIPKQILNCYYPFSSATHGCVKISDKAYCLIVLQLFRFLYSEKIIPIDAETKEALDDLKAYSELMKSLIDSTLNKVTP